MANTIQIKRKTTTGAPLVGSLSDGEMCLVLPDSALYMRVDTFTLIQVNGGGSADLKPYCARGSGSDITQTESNVGLTIEEMSNANYSLAADAITVQNAGDYQISYSIKIDEDSTAGSTRRRCDAHVEIGLTVIPQSEMATYLREASGGGGISNTFNVTLGALSVLTLRTVLDAAGPDVSVESGQISILKVG